MLWRASPSRTFVTTEAVPMTKGKVKPTQKAVKSYYAAPQHYLRHAYAETEA